MTLPDTAHLGDPGHIQDHNDIVTALNTLTTAVAPVANNTTAIAAETARATAAEATLTTNATAITNRVTTAETTLANLSTNYIPTTTSGIVDVSGLLGPISKAPSNKKISMISTFQSGHGWASSFASTTTTANNTTTYRLGTQSASVVSSGLGSGSPANFRKLAMPNMDLSASSLRMLIRVDNLAKLTSLTAYIGNASLANFYLVSIFNPGDGFPFVDGEWAWLEFNFTGSSAAATTTGTPSKSTITDIQFRWTDDGTGPVTIYFNALGIVSNTTKFTNGVVSLSFDDTYANQYSTAMPVLDTYGFGASAMTIADQVGYDVTKLSLANLQEMVNFHNWEVAGHAYTAANHNAGYSTLSASVLDNELRAMKTWLVAHGFGQYDYLAYPLGQYQGVEENVKKYFSAGRTIIPAPMGVLPPATPTRIRSKSVTNTTTTASLTAQIDAAYSGGNWLNLTFHSIVASPSIVTEYSTANFTTVVNYLNTKGIPVLPMGEVMKLALNA